MHDSHDHLWGGLLPSALTPICTLEQASLPHSSQLPSGPNMSITQRTPAVIRSDRESNVTARDDLVPTRTSVLVRGSTPELDNSSVTEDGCDLFADYPLMSRMITVVLKVCLSGKGSDDREVMTRWGEADIAATEVAFDTVKVGDEGAKRVGGSSGFRGLWMNDILLNSPSYSTSMGDVSGGMSRRP